MAGTRAIAEPAYRFGMTLTHAETGSSAADRFQFIVLETVGEAPDRCVRDVGIYEDAVTSDRVDSVLRRLGEELEELGHGLVGPHERRLRSVRRHESGSQDPAGSAVDLEVLPHATVPLIPLGFHGTYHPVVLQACEVGSPFTRHESRGKFDGLRYRFWTYAHGSDPIPGNRVVDSQTAVHEGAAEEPRDAEIDTLNGNRIRLLAKKYASEAFSREEEARLEILQERIARLLPAVDHRDFERLEELAATTRDVHERHIERMQRLGLE